MIVSLLDSQWFPVIYLAILFFCIVTGIIASRILKLEQRDDSKSTGLLFPFISFFSLLLAFTLTSSADSNKERANLLHQHTDAIGDLYRKSFLFNDSLQKSIQSYVTKCLELKIQASKLHGVARKAEDEKSFWLNQKYARDMSALAISRSPHHHAALSIVEDLNKIIALDNRFHYSNQERTPIVVMILLLIGSWTLGFLMGLVSVLFKKHYYLGPVIFIAFTSLTVIAIQDMDNPHTGLIRPPYEIYEIVLKEIKSVP